MTSSNTTKVHSVPLAAYGPPALLVLSADTFTGASMAHAYLMLPRTESEARPPVLAKHYQLGAAATTEQAMKVARIAIEEDIANARASIAISNRSTDVVQAADVEDFAIRRGLGQYPSFDDLLKLELTAEVRAALKPFGAGFALTAWSESELAKRCPDAPP